VPDSPNGLKVNADVAFVNGMNTKELGLEWVEKKGSDGGAAITSYTLKICKSKSVCTDQTFTPIWKEKLSGGHYKCTHFFYDLDLGYTYTLSLTAENKVGQSPSSSITHTHTYMPDRVTEKPLIASIDYENEKVTLVWNLVKENGGSSITKYWVNVATNPDFDYGTF
jgi:hypothetical protein